MHRLATRIYGNPPVPGAPKIERLRYVRRVAYLTTLPPMALVIVVIVLSGSRFGDGVAFAVGCIWLFGFVVINLQIRGERRKGNQQD